MKDFFTQFANFFNKSGTLNTVVWFSVLLIACIICAMSRKKELAGLIVAGAVCFFVSFSPLSMGIQAIIFAAIVTAWLFGSKIAGQNKAQDAATDNNGTEEENVQNG